MSPITRVKLTKFGDRETVNIRCDYPEELEKIPPILKELLSKNSTAPNSEPSLSAKVKETMAVEPIRLVFRVFAGVILAVIVYWFGFR